MKRQITVEGVTAKQARAIEAALADESTRALAIIIGTLKPFTPRAQARILEFVRDQIDENQQADIVTH